MLSELCVLVGLAVRCSCAALFPFERLATVVAQAMSLNQMCCVVVVFVLALRVSSVVVVVVVVLASSSSVRVSSVVVVVECGSLDCR